MLKEDIHGHLLRDAVRIAKSVGYSNVGTIEFLLDARGEYHFMKMNTRIQVEHTISEEICGIDLIKQQIHTMDGHKFVYRQENIVCYGHVIECRISAENIKYNSAPNLRQVSFINFPLGHRIRIEGTVYNDYNIPPYYGSMIAKIITYANTRLECIKRVRSVLGEPLIEGAETNIEFQYLLLHHLIFAGGCCDIGFMESLMKELEEDETII